jgi:hypothetical protein
VAVDGAGNVYLTGSYQGTVNLGKGNEPSAGGSDAYVIGLTSAGAYRWSRRIGGSLWDYCDGVGVDAGGNVALHGRFQGTVNFGGGPLVSAGSNDLFVASYTQAGLHRWSKRFGGSSSDRGFGIAAGTNHLCLAGSYNNNLTMGTTYLTSKGLEDAVLFSLKSGTGAVTWAKSIGATANDLGSGAAQDASGTCYFTGRFSGSPVVTSGTKLASNLGSEDLFVSSFSGVTGVHQWSESFGGTNTDFGNALAVNSSGQLFVVGGFRGSISFGSSILTGTGMTGPNGFIASLSASSGQAQWSQSISGGLTSQLKGVVALSSVEFVTGSRGGNVLLNSYNSAGGQRWSKPYGIGEGRGVTASAKGVVSTGYFSSVINLGGAPLTSAGLHDVFSAGHSSANGTHAWSTRYGGTNTEQSYGVAVHPTTGRCYMVGFFNGKMPVGGQKLISNGGEDQFIIAFDPP